VRVLARPQPPRL